MEYMNKELDDMSEEFYGLRSQFTHLENSVGKISDKQAALVNKMAAKPESLNNDESCEINTALLNLVMKDQFAGLPSEDVATHLNSFVDLCDMQKKNMSIMMSLN